MILQLFFMKSLRLIFIGAFIILNIYSFYPFYQDVNNINKVEKNFPFPNDTGIMKIDVGRGEDLWILTEKYELYHWDAIEGKFIRKARTDEPIHDVSIGSDGTAIISDYIYDLCVRNDIDLWNCISGSYYFRSISICDHNKYFTTNNYSLFAGSYDNNRYTWDRIATHYYYYQISCAPHDQSLWFIGNGHYAYLYFDEYNKIPRSEATTRFRQIKALSKQRAIGVDFNYTLWEYTYGTWTRIKNNVKIASINYNGDIFYVKNTDNLIYRLSKD